MFDSTKKQLDLDTLTEYHRQLVSIINTSNSGNQVSTMPTASATWNGKVVQYVGTTDANYIKGYFYECVNNNGTYSWTLKNVQEGGTGGAEYPSGGTTGQALIKKSNADNDVEWGNVSVTVDSALSNSSENPVQNKVIKSALDGKQDTISFDTTPTNSSTNPITSGGVYTALAGKQDTLTIDSSLSSSSENPVQNKVVKSAIDNKADSSTTYSKTDVDGITGSLSSLTTTAKTNLVAAINEVASSGSGGGVSDFDDLSNRPESSTELNMEEICFPLPAKSINYTMFGMHIHGMNADPENITYLADARGMTPAHMDFESNEFDYGSWKSFIEDICKPCMVTYSGEIDYYLDPNDFTKKIDGTTTSDVANMSYAGNAMAKRSWNDKPIWYKVVPMNGGNSACVYFSDKKVDDDFVCWSFINNQGEQINHYFTQLYNMSLADGKLRSMSGQAVQNTTTRQQEVTYAKANNTGEDVLWYIETIADRSLDQLLLYLIGGNLNSQGQFGRGLCDSGTEAINNGFRTGVHNNKGLFYGTNSGVASTYTNAVKLFGRENWYGFIWQACAGIINANGTIKYKMTYGTEDNSSSNSYNFDGTGYLTAGVTPSGTNGGYINRMIFKKNGILLPYISSGSESSYFCDGLWFNNSQNNYGFLGGGSGVGSPVGVTCCHLCNLASQSGWSIGGSLSCKPRS